MISGRLKLEAQDGDQLGPLGATPEVFGDDTCASCSTSIRH